MRRLEIPDMDAFFARLDAHISRQHDAPAMKFTLVAVGGTSLTLRDWKLSTKDVDFMVADADHERVKRWARAAAPDIKADLWAETHIFSTTLPGDYETERFASFRNFDVTLLSAIDVAATKIGRLSEADAEDIRTIIIKGVKKEHIIARAEQILAAGGYANAEAAREKIKTFKAIAKDW